MATSSSNCAVDLSGKTYSVITGASQGIGRAIAIELSKLLGEGSLILLLARSKEGLLETKSLCDSSKISIITKSVDLSTITPNEVSDVLKESLEGRSIGEFDSNIIFHNVGTLGNVSIHACEVENIQEMRDYFDLNVFNVIALNTKFLNLVKGFEDRTVIVNVTSLAAIKPMTGMAYYCTGKAGRELFFRVLAEEMSELRVLNYSPGPVETAMAQQVLDEAVNENLLDVFKSFRSKNILLQADMTAKKCMLVLQEGKYKSGDHVDYFD